MGMIYNNQSMRYEYVPDVPQYQNMAQMQQPKANNQGLLWVSGEAGAKAWIVPPNQTTLLMDSESNRFYIKSADGAGMPSIKTYEYKEVTASVMPTQSNQNYSEEINQIKAQLHELTEKYKQLTEKEVEYDG